MADECDHYSAGTCTWLVDLRCGSKRSRPTFLEAPAEWECKCSETRERSNGAYFKTDLWTAIIALF